jgi:hypothetical protein
MLVTRLITKRLPKSLSQKKSMVSDSEDQTSRPPPPAAVHPTPYPSPHLAGTSKDAHCATTPHEQKHQVRCTQLFSLDVSAVVLFRHGLEKQGGFNKFNLSEIVHEI